MTARNLLVASCLSISFVAIASAGGAADEVRPANFYALVTSNSSSICPVVLKSLNERYVLPTVPNQPDVDRIPGKFLLTSDIQVHWRQAVGENGEYMDFAKVDFQNDGKLQMIYRIPGSLGGLVSETVGTSKYDPGDLEGGSLTTPAMLSQKIESIEQRPSSLSEPSQFTTPQWKDKKDKPSDSRIVFGFPSLFIDVVAVAAGSYMLATSAHDADEFYEHYVVLKDYHGKPRVDVYLLQYVKDGDIPMICHFRKRI